MQSNTVVLVEKHYIPLDVYRQLYGGNTTSYLQPQQVRSASETVNTARQSTASTTSESHVSSSSSSAAAGNRLFQTVLENFFPRSTTSSSSTSSSSTNRRGTRRTQPAAATTAMSGNTQHHQTGLDSDNSDEHSGRVGDGESAATTASVRRIIVNESTGDEDSTVLVSLFLNNILGSFGSNVSTVSSSSSTGNNNGLTRHQMDAHSQIYTYRQPPPEEGNTAASSNVVCSICSADFIDGEYIRQLNRCSHSFHRPCIDIWLSSHNNCPLCRANVIADIDNID